MLTVKKLSVAYCDTPIFNNLSVHFNAGKITGIIEPNGAGKSTLIKAILGLIHPKSGSSAIDAEGLTLDIWLRKKRDTQAAYSFLKRLQRQFGEPKVLVTDKAPSISRAFKKLQKNDLFTKTAHRTVKYLNNLIEQDHRSIKRRHKLYQSLRTASSTIKGMETLRGIYKKSRKEGTLFGFSVCTEIKVLMGITA